MNHSSQDLTFISSHFSHPVHWRLLSVFFLSGNHHNGHRPVPSSGHWNGQVISRYLPLGLLHVSEALHSYGSDHEIGYGEVHCHQEVS